MGAVLVTALALLIVLAPRLTAPLREAWFDACQALSPRVVTAMPAVVVAIDGPSLAAFGRWPWPRSLLAELVDRVNGAGPAALGIDILMPEPDPLSPEELRQWRGAGPPARHREQAEWPTNDALLARALAAAPAVLAVAGLPERSGRSLRSPPFVVQDRAAASAADGLAAARIERFAGALTSVDAVDRVARGWGLVSADPVGGVIRRVPLVAEIDGTLIGALTIEMFRVAAGAPSLRLVLSGPTVEGIAVGRALVPTEADGGARVYFSRRHAGRFVSAVDVLEDRVDPERLRQKLVLVAVTGLGLGEYHATPVGERMPGSEIHAQLLENLYDGTLLSRPSWGPVLEAALFALLATLLIVATPAWAPRHALWVAVGGVAILLASGYAAFRTQRLLFDAATPSLALLLVFGALLVATLAEATRHRRSLEQVLQRQREHNARIAGELDAARRIQTAMLPRAGSLGPDRRLDLAAAMLPAREVGGDLYDFFRLDERRLFFLVGDVAGKGLSASIFMAVSKALYKSTTLRMETPDLGTLMAAANAEVSRDNPEALFVTAFAAILDLDSGTLAYCNAGHENPFRVDPVGAGVLRITDGDGPPLCAVDAFAYRGARLQLEPGELLCVVSDGVTEARNPGGDLYGSARLAAVLHRGREAPVAAGAVVATLLADVANFAAGAEPADDITVLALRWNGPSAGPAPGQVGRSEPVKKSSRAGGVQGANDATDETYLLDRRGGSE
ncbi:MAG: CHASE2 domain-containing protein [Betaproteobacteria bacterium]|nr:CHASE2 domain-containing protein [Betaproteobacteria bacterium]